MREVRQAVYVKLSKAERRPIVRFAKDKGIPISTAIRMLAAEGLEERKRGAQGACAI